ncbi:hypothetical protein OPV22_027941 [Ensete ventricosum]|uniref:Homeobox domain-containing protein n=1 Tax=Ensete ventricosum TaxID=4639 RepID=A0AAV8Q1N2_ENSVE|nr:hypothetical protein OPV22_027941 [Ensete ventricosum]
MPNHLLLGPSGGSISDVGGAGETRPLLTMIDVTRALSVVATARKVSDEEEEEEGGASSLNSAVSSVGGKRAERHGLAGDDHDAERACFRVVSDEEDGEGSRKKLRLSKDQSAVLEESFKKHSTLNPKQKLALAEQLNLRPRQVEVWFQNRRARTKLKQTEVDCEFLKKCCESLTKENRRLQKEVQELRALKLSPQLYKQMTPPTTLTMCPSCERVSNPATTSSPANPQPSGQHQYSNHDRQTTASWVPFPLEPLFLDSIPQRS